MFHKQQNYNSGRGKVTEGVTGFLVVGLVVDEGEGLVWLHRSSVDFLITLLITHFCIMTMKWFY